METEKLKRISLNIRKDIIRAVHAAGSGHPGGSLSATDILTVLFFDIMKIDPENPNMKDRDKFVLSKGHANPALYSALAERGFFSVQELLTLRKLGSKLQGHPNMHYVPGVEMSTGSLGQGLSVSVGMALANRLDNNIGRVFTLMGDGEIQEGMIWEAAMSAVNYKLDNLIAIVDWNGLQIDGSNDEVMRVAPIDEKFRGFGWNVISCDGHDFEALAEAFNKAVSYEGAPTVIIAKTIKGKGVSFMENQAGWHGKAPDDEQYAQAMKELGGDF